MFCALVVQHHDGSAFRRPHFDEASSEPWQIAADLSTCSDFQRHISISYIP